MASKELDAPEASAHPEEQAFMEYAELYRLYEHTKTSFAENPNQRYANNIKKSLKAFEAALKLGRGTLH